MEWASSYDFARSPIRSFDLHERWMLDLNCPIIRLNSDRPVEALCNEVLRLAAVQERPCGQLGGYTTMPNGTPGDHPYTDIVIHSREVYSTKADTLVREIANLADESTRRALQDRLMSEFNMYRIPGIARLEQILTVLRDQLRREAQDRGFEV